MEQELQTPPTPTVTPAPSVQNSAQPSMQSPKPSRGKRKPFAVTMSIAVILALALGVTGIVLANTKADKASQTKQMASLQKRLTAIETADQFPAQQVDDSLFQAVFLESGQAYFGKITKITKDTIVLEDIFYLQSGTIDKAGNPTVGGDVSLVKLGSELHAPQDKMVIERKNNSFWENLKRDGEVSKAIYEYQKQHPS